MTIMVPNFTIKENLDVLCLKSNIAISKPIDPPIKARKNNVFSGILRFCLIAANLSNPAITNSRTFMTKKYINKISIG
jgi:hypothetical protein